MVADVTEAADTSSAHRAAPSPADASWCTDAEIGTAGGAGPKVGRELEAWKGPGKLGAGKRESFDTALEELAVPGSGRGGRGVTGWDQFEANWRLFGVKSSFRGDLSQYTTPLDVTCIPPAVRRRAKWLAAEIDGKGKAPATLVTSAWGEDGDNDFDEEDLFSAVQPGGGGGEAPARRAPRGGGRLRRP